MPNTKKILKVIGLTSVTSVFAWLGFIFTTSGKIIESTTGMSSFFQDNPTVTGGLLFMVIFGLSFWYFWFWYKRKKAREYNQLLLDYLFSKVRYLEQTKRAHADNMQFGDPSVIDFIPPGSGHDRLYVTQEVKDRLIYQYTGLAQQGREKFIETGEVIPELVD